MDILIRAAKIEDLDRISYIENACFPEREAASYASLQARLQAFKTSFLVAERAGQVIGFINGCITTDRRLTDELYASTDRHDEQAPNQMVFGLAVHPSAQRQGIASLLMQAYISQAKARQKNLITLTCKKPLVSFYEHFGYQYEGRSSSAHGGVCWQNMTLFLQPGLNGVVRE